MTSSVFRAILQDHREGFQGTPEQHAILRALSRCRTAAAGVHHLACGSCGHTEIRHNSCRNRHCPTCQARERHAWVEARERDLLPIPYFHVVCTLPHELLPVARHAPAVTYGLLMRCSRQAIAELTEDPRHLGATVGQVQILHTWGSRMNLHPHVHTMVTGGGLTSEGSWKPCRVSRKRKSAFLIPINCLRARFRKLMISGLWQAFRDGELAQVPEAQSGRRWNQLLRTIARKSWVVYAKRPFGSPEQVVRYLGRYTHRVAISPSRILSYDGHHVQIQWKDYHHGGRQRILTLTADEFIRRFVLHILPGGFRRIRLAGFLAPRCRAEKLDQARRQLGARPPPPPPPVADDQVPHATTIPQTHSCCPRCQSTDWHTVLVVKPIRGGGVLHLVPRNGLSGPQAPPGNLPHQKSPT